MAPMASPAVDGRRWGMDKIPTKQNPATVCKMMELRLMYQAMDERLMASVAVSKKAGKIEPQKRKAGAKPKDSVLCVTGASGRAAFVVGCRQNG